MRQNPRRNPWIRVIVMLLIAAMLITDRAAVAFAEEASPNEGILNTVADPDNTDAPLQEGLVPVSEDPAPEDPVDAEGGDGVLDDDKAEPAEDPKEEPKEETAGDAVSGAEAEEDQVPVEEDFDENKLEIDGSVVIDEAHGEVGQILRQSLRSFSNQSRTDYYRRYYNQLGAYGKEIYDYLEEHAEEFITKDPTVSGYKAPELRLNGGDPVTGNISSLMSEVENQIYYAYAAFDYDHPEVFWLNTNAFNFQYGHYSSSAGYYPVVLFSCRSNCTSYTYYNSSTYTAAKNEMQGNLNTIATNARQKSGIKAKLTVINDWLSNNNYYNRYVSTGHSDQADPLTWKSVAALTAQTWLTSSSDRGDPKAPVCEAYSRAFKMVCDEIGIPCIVVPGDGHMWNYVQTDDGVWYAVDVTWDDPVRSDEYSNRTTPESVIHRYVMVGSATVVSGKSDSFLEDGHHPNGTFWTDGRVMPTPGISESAYAKELSAQISDLSVISGDDEMQISYHTDQSGTFYYVFRAAGETAPSVYEIQDQVSDIINGAGTGTVTEEQAEAGSVTFSVLNPPEGTYDLYLIQLTPEEYISPVLYLENVEPLPYVGWLRKDHHDYFFCPENYEGWEENIVDGEHINDRGAMATGAVWIGNVLYKFGEDGICEKIWHRIESITIDAIPETDPSAVAQNVLQRGKTYQLNVNYVPEEDIPFEEITDDTGVRWTSSNPQAVLVDRDGTVHALQVTDEAVTITGKAGDDENRYHPTATIAIRVTYPEGWFSVEGNRFYGKKTAGTVELASGLQTIDGKVYYFYPADDAEHVPYSMATGIVKIGDDYYDFGDNGVRTSADAIRNGFVSSSGKTYYMQDGAPVSGIRKIEGHYYGFDNEGVLYVDTFFKQTDDGKTWYYFADQNGILAEGMREISREGLSCFADAAYASVNDVPVCSMQSGVVTLPEGSYYFSALTEENGLDGALEVSGGIMQYGYFAGADAKHYYALPKGNANAGKLQSGLILVADTWKLFSAADSASPFAEAEGTCAGGWIDADDAGTHRRFYVNASGRFLSGWQTIDGNRYYFDPDGSVASGLRRIGKSSYFFGTNSDFGQPGDDFGILLTGLKEYGGHTYYADGSGMLQLGLQKIDGIWRYFDRETGHEIEGAAVGTDNWLTVNGHRYYYKNGTTMLTGIQQIGGLAYYFSTDASDGSLGRLVCSDFIQVGKNRYYADENGVLKTGLFTVGEDTYYANAKGILLNGWQTVNGGSFFFESDGRMARGWFLNKNKKYYIEADGSLKTGEQVIDGRNYLFNAKNELVTGWQITDTRTGTRSYFNDISAKEDVAYGAREISAYLGNGFYRVTIDGANYYYRFVNNSMQTGWQTIDGKKYCFGTNGQLQTGLFQFKNTWYYTSETGELGELGSIRSGLLTIEENGNSKTCYLDANGKCLSGWQTIGGKTYYFNPAAGEDYGAMMFGRIRIGNKYYFTDHDGVKQVNSFVNFYGETYFANASGVLLTGFQTIKVEGVPYTFYFDAEGRMQIGWQTISKAGYYFCPGGDYPMGALATGLREIDGKTCYFSTKGVLQTGWQKINKIWYYFATQTDVSEGRADVWGECCYDEEGDAAADYWRTFTFAKNNQQCSYYIKNHSTVLKGWQTLKIGGVNRTLYFDPDSGRWLGGSQIEDSGIYLLEVGGKTYRLDANGYKVTGAGLVNDSYYFDKNGQLLTGWQTQKIDGVKRTLYFDPLTGLKQVNAKLTAPDGKSVAFTDGSGYLVTNAFHTYPADSENRFYCNAKGAALSGWQKINGIWYYFATKDDVAKGREDTAGVCCYDEEGGAAADYWRTVTFTDGTTCRYYINNKGKLLTGWQSIKEGGVSKRYYFNKAGELQDGDFAVNNVRYHVDAGTPRAGFWKDPENRWYYYNASGQMLTGWQSIKCGDGKTRKYYLNTNGVLLTGAHQIGTSAYFFDEGGATADSKVPGQGSNTYGMMRTGEIVSLAGDGYYAGSKGVLMSGWQKFKGVGETQATWKYYDPVSFKRQTAERYYGEEDEDKNKNWYHLTKDTASTADDDWYYFNRDASLTKGFATISFASGGLLTHRYYFDSTGKLLFGQDNWLRIGNDVYYVWDARGGRPETGNFGLKTGSRIRGLNDFYEADGKYYFIDDSGKRLTGFQTIHKSVYYFDPADGHMVTGFFTVKGTTYYFSEEEDTLGIMQTGTVQTDENTSYRFNDKGAMQRGWVLVDGTWKYFGADGVMIAPNPEPVYNPTSGPYWISVTEGGKTRLFYINKNKTVYKKWQNIGDDRYYFDLDTGELYTGDFVVGSSFYHAAETGAILKKTWFDRSADVREYYNASGARVSGWQTLDKDGSTNKYWFDADGKMATGVTSVDGVRYLFGDAADRGALLKNAYVTQNEKKYKSDTSGKVLTGWQKFEAEGETKWHYFDPLSGEEDVGAVSDVEPGAQWLETDGTKTYVNNGTIVKGWKTIDGKTYYFDAATGAMATGFATVSGKKYLFDEDGILQTGKSQYYGNYYFPNAKGELRFGWITDTSRRYYADPASGKLRTGFVTISGYNYYFSEEESKAGELCTGFFRVPNLGQSYYDRSQHASNLYYAASDGKLHAPGWDEISANPADRNAQKWSYCFSANVTGTTPEGSSITGEAATGSVLIGEDGIVTFLGSDDNPGGVNEEKYYRFDPQTGARKKTVLVFYGNYYGEADYDYDLVNNVITNVRNIRGRFSKEQVNGFASLSRFINSDRNDTETDAVYYVNSNRAADQERLYTAGFTNRNPAQTTFPMAATSHPLAGSENSAENRVYVAGNDIANGPGTAGRDGNVDVYDVEMYSWEVYQNAIAKVGANNLVLTGASSGGGICLALCQKALDEGLKLPANTILFSPWVDLAMDNPQIAGITPAQSGFMDAGTAKYWAARYTRDNDLTPDHKLANAADDAPGVEYPFASPINGRMTGLQNVVIYTGSYDLFCPDCQKLANAALAAGSDVTISVKSGMVHAYMFNKPTLSVTVQTMRDAARKIMTE